MSIHFKRGVLERVVAERAPEACKRVAEEIADAVRRQGLTVTSDGGGSDETRLPVTVFENKDSAAVAITHPAGEAMQAKHGALTRAAAAKGFEVRS